MTTFWKYFTGVLGAVAIFLGFMGLPTNVGATGKATAHVLPTACGPAAVQMIRSRADWITVVSVGAYQCSRDDAAEAAEWAATGALAAALWRCGGVMVKSSTQEIWEDECMHALGHAQCIADTNGNATVKALNDPDTGVAAWLKRYGQQKLTPAQNDAHNAFLDAGCVLDDAVQPVAAANIRRFSIGCSLGVGCQAAEQVNVTAAHMIPVDTIDTLHRRALAGETTDYARAAE